MFKANALTVPEQILLLPYEFSRIFKIVFLQNTSWWIPADLHLLKVNIENTRTMFEICFKLTKKTPE